MTRQVPIQWVHLYIGGIPHVGLDSQLSRKLGLGATSLLPTPLRDLRRDWALEDCPFILDESDCGS